MKSSLLTWPIVLTVGLSLQCSCIAEKVNGTGGTNSASRTAAGSQPEDYAELRRRHRAMENEIESASRKLGVENLKEVSATNEIRVWVGFGVTYPRLFISQLSGERRASYLTLTTPQNGIANDRVQETTMKVPLGSPKSGWDEFEQFLKGQGIISPSRLTQESSKYLRSPDVQVIAIEDKSGDDYGMVFFHLDNKSDSAQRALAVCRRIEQDFEIDMYCGAPDPSPVTTLDARLR